ncbi:winged helix-turn-helix domain-containing protein [Candidatus Woesearchaeota archaeon]|nr:winged helix-turn-helix domain-containing protein [Candidatus Woesearchaeota archaeon]HLC80380.1 helix-turn-helix domain-containing protein [Candidatus Nanoarchaeia archaeon]
MKGTELVYREILYQAMEKKNRVLTQAQIARALNCSLSTVNRAVSNLKRMGAVEIRTRSLHVLDIKKILFYWASLRNLPKDIVYATRVEKPVREIEKLMPEGAIFGAYSAYKFVFDDVPADYSEVYVYGDESLKKRFPPARGPPNLFVLERDKKMKRYGKIVTSANLFVDLWNLRGWYAKEFVKAMEGNLNGILE